MIHVFAPAKLNLTLHVTGRRPDGYHDLDSLVVLLDYGDMLSLAPSDHWSLQVDGPFRAGVPVDDRNLITKAAQWLSAKVGRPLTAEVRLTKNLPPASGIGGGSSDAAATIKGLCQLYDLALPNPAELVALGADIPVCMGNGLMRMRGIGDKVSGVIADASFSVLMVNPRVAVSTPKVFAGLKNPENGPLTDYDQDNFFKWIASQRNDLQSPACAAEPIIETVLHAISKTQGARVTRMSGSGATCFGIFSDHAECHAAHEQIASEHPEWWTAIGRPIMT